MSFERIEQPHLLKALQICCHNATLPSRRQLSGNLLTYCYLKVKKSVDKYLKQASADICLVSDGWSNINNKPIINYMAVCGDKKFFLESVNTGEQEHTSDWLAQDMMRVAMDIDARITGVVMDNTSANKKAWAKLSSRQNTLLCHGCASHALHLLVKDIFSPTVSVRATSKPGKTVEMPYPFEEIYQFTSECKDLIVHFRLHHKLKCTLARLLKAANAKMLVLPASTRWGSIMASFETLIQADTVLKLIVNHQDFVTGTKKLKMKQQQAKDFVLDPNYLPKLQRCRALLEPIELYIKKFQDDTVPVSDVYQAFKTLPQAFDELQFLNEEQKNFIKERLQLRFELLYGHAHGIGNLLDPRYLGDNMSAEEQEEVEDILFQYPKDDGTLCEHRQKNIFTQYTEWRITALAARTQGRYRYKMLIDGNKSILQYWQSNTGKWPLLCAIGICIFSMCASSAAAERNFLLHSFVHSKRRNRLSHDKILKLMYIQTNVAQLTGDFDAQAYYNSDNDNDSVI